MQVLGQVSFGFEVSIAQILIAVLTCAILDVVVVARREHVLAWPASALLTGNGIALLLRVSGTRHGDWWSLRGWWIFAGTAALGIASKYAFRRGTRPVFNPSNVALVVCFVMLGTNRVNPQDLWWGPPSPALVAAQAVIVVGGLLLLLRLRLAGASAGFWVSFAAAIAVIAVAGHAMTARWHVGTVSGATYWWVLVTSPEVLIFLFFMITDPQTLPASPQARLRFGLTVGVLSALFASATSTEFGTKLALLAALTVACAVRPLLDRDLVLRARPLATSALAVVVALAVFGHATRAEAPRLVPQFLGEVFVPSDLPPVSIDPAVAQAGAQLDALDAQRLAARAMATVRADTARTYTITAAAVVLVSDGSRPQSAPKLGVRLTGSMRDGTAETPFDRTVEVSE